MEANNNETTYCTEPTYSYIKLHIIAVLKATCFGCTRLP